MADIYFEIELGTAITKSVAPPASSVVVLQKQDAYIRCVQSLSTSQLNLPYLQLGNISLPSFTFGFSAHFVSGIALPKYLKGLASQQMQKGSGERKS
uniref:Uncharacterized protein n=1 Tax=Ascaris lumbricoides TaxID=6252 RepID=A0A0M3HU53_ASCLU